MLYSLSFSGYFVRSSNNQHPPIAVLTLQQELLLHEILPAYRAGDEAGARPAVCVVVLPLAVETW